MGAITESYTNKLLAELSQIFTQKVKYDFEVQQKLLIQNVSLQQQILLELQQLNKNLAEKL